MKRKGEKERRGSGREGENNPNKERERGRRELKQVGHRE
jgi:hypothetical protein